MTATTQPGWLVRKLKLLKSPSRVVRALNRKRIILRHIDTARQRGLEIGPLVSPVVQPGDGEIHYLDHASTAELKEKYASEPSVDTNRIAKIDFVLRDQTIGELFRYEKSFDYIIASHVIEHVPDIISWFRELSSILGDKGVLSLAIPDKRYTFDYLRNASVTAELIEAYLDKRTRPSTRQIFDHLFNHVELNGSEAWDHKKRLNVTRSNRRPKEILQFCSDYLGKPDYIDVHCYTFTEQSFFQILDDLIQLDLFDFEILSFDRATYGTIEFFVSLRKLSSEIDANEKRRLQFEGLRRLYPT